MIRTRHILTALTLCLTVCGCSCTDSRQPAAEAVATDTLPRLVMQIQQCSRLYTAEYKIHKIVTHDDVVRLKGNFMSRDFNIALPLGERKIAIPMDATLKAYIDFSEFSEENVERHGDRITILLPDPKVVLTASKIDQKGIKSYVGLARAHFSDKEMSHYEQQGRQAIIDRAEEMGILRTAQENAARVLVPMMVELGFREENVTIAYRHELDIRKLINSNLEK